MTGTVLKYPGSKNQIADTVIGLFPEGYRKMTYLEPFFGSGAVFFRKAPSVVETLNDLDSAGYNFFRQLRDHGEELAGLINYTPWSREEYETAYIMTDDDLENARRFLVRYWFSIGAKSYCRTGFKNNIQGDNGNIGAWSKLPANIFEVSQRLKPRPGNIVQLENRDAVTLIEKYGRKNVLMYLDPPYVLASRKNKHIYRHEMTGEDHEKLCEVISVSPAKIVLSGYANALYEKRLHNWYRTTVPATDEMGRTRTEVIWTNFVPAGQNVLDFEDETAVSA